MDVEIIIFAYKIFITTLFQLQKLNSVEWKIIMNGE
jgi:hypothetical protein